MILIFEFLNFLFAFLLIISISKAQTVKFSFVEFYIKTYLVNLKTYTPNTRLSL